MNLHQLTDPREKEILTLCHAMAETALRPLRDVEADLRTMAARVQQLLSGGPH